MVYIAKVAAPTVAPAVVAPKVATPGMTMDPSMAPAQLGAGMMGDLNMQHNVTDAKVVTMGNGVQPGVQQSSSEGLFDMPLKQIALDQKVGGTTFKTSGLDATQETKVTGILAGQTDAVKAEADLKAAGFSVETNAANE